MRKVIPALTILCFFICVGQVPAAVGLMGSNVYYPQDIAKATGTVVATGRNSIDIYDEYRKTVERFVDLDRDNPYHKGDYIRIYYHPENAVVVTIKRMTVLKYDANGQNLGYISKQKAQLLRFQP